jgi:hypothetical protein
MDYFCAAPGISLAWIFRKWIIFALRQEFHLPGFLGNGLFLRCARNFTCLDFISQSMFNKHRPLFQPVFIFQIARYDIYDTAITAKG